MFSNACLSPVLEWFQFIGWRTTAGSEYKAKKEILHRQDTVALGVVSGQYCSVSTSKHAKLHLNKRAHNVLLLSVPKRTETARYFTEMVKFLRMEEWHWPHLEKWCTYYREWVKRPTPEYVMVKSLNVTVNTGKDFRGRTGTSGDWAER